MHSNGPRGIFRYGEKSLHYGVTGSGAVDEKQVLVVESSISEPPGIVHAFVEPHDRTHIVMSEVREVELW